MQASEGGTLAVGPAPVVAACAGTQLTASEASPAACEDKAVSAWKGAAACRRIAVSELLQHQHLLQDMHVAAAAVAAAERVELLAAVAGSPLHLLPLLMGHSCWIPDPTLPAHFQ